MKPLCFVGTSLDDLREFPKLARRQAGAELRRVQNGENPSDWKPMSSIGPGVREIRIHREGAWRVIYVATLPAAVYVLHAFPKTTQATRLPDIELARRRFRQIRGV